jgi:hypothetical protein
MEKEYKKIYRYLEVEFSKHHHSSQNKIEDLEGEIKGLQACILDLEAQIVDPKAINNKWKMGID